MWKKVFWKICVRLHFLIFYWFLTFHPFELGKNRKCAIFLTHNVTSWINKEIKPIKNEGVGAIYATVSVLLRGHKNGLWWLNIKNKSCSKCQGDFKFGLSKNWDNWEYAEMVQNWLKQQNITNISCKKWSKGSEFGLSNNWEITENVI